MKLTSSLPQISLPPTPFSSPPSQSPPPLLGDSSHLQRLPSLAEEKPSLNHFPFSQSSSHIYLRPFTFPLAPLQPPCSSGQTQRVSCFRGSWKSRKNKICHGLEIESRKLPFLKVCSRRAKNCTLETDTQYLIQYKEECGRRYKKVSTYPLRSISFQNPFLIDGHPHTARCAMPDIVVQRLTLGAIRFVLAIDGCFGN